MPLRGRLIWTCTLAVWFSSACGDETQTCPWDTAKPSAAVEVALTCGENLLLSQSSLFDILHKHQLKECQGAEPKICPEAVFPSNGGLACVTVDNKHLCKPMCNYGYDFGFLRRSRLYDECSEQTGYKWDTQYIGGNKLAVCNKEPVQIAGAQSAYFPEDQDCRTTKSSNQLQNSTLQMFINELKNKGIQGEAQYACLVCG